MKFILVIIFTIFLQLPIKVDSIYIYKNFKGKGFTTAGASTHFKDMDRQIVGFIIVSQNDKRKILKIMTNAKCIKHSQKKFPPPLFTKFIIEGKRHNIVMFKNSIVDLTDFKEFWVKDLDDKIWLERYYSSFF